MNITQTYTVYPSDDSDDAETGLTSHDVVRHIYRDDGADYRLDAKMITNRFDDNDNELPDIQETTEDGDLVFDVYFKDNNSFPWRKSQRIAIGKNEDEAEMSFLQESFENNMWDDSRWTVLTDEQYQSDTNLYI